MESRETIEKKFKFYLRIFFLFILFITLVSLYQHEKWKHNKEVIKEEIPTAHRDMIYVIEYKYFSFDNMCWIYRVSTPTSNPIQYYEWNKEKNTLIKIKNEDY